MNQNKPEKRLKKKKSISILIVCFMLLSIFSPAATLANEAGAEEVLDISQDVFVTEGYSSDEATQTEDESGEYADDAYGNDEVSQEDDESGAYADDEYELLPMATNESIVALSGGGFNGGNGFYIPRYTYVGSGVSWLYGSFRVNQPAGVDDPFTDGGAFGGWGRDVYVTNIYELEVNMYTTTVMSNHFAISIRRLSPNNVLLVDGAECDFNIPHDTPTEVDLSFLVSQGHYVVFVSQRHIWGPQISNAIIILINIQRASSFIQIDNTPRIETAQAITRIPGVAIPQQGLPPIDPVTITVGRPEDNTHGDFRYRWEIRNASDIIVAYGERTGYTDENPNPIDIASLNLLAGLYTITNTITERPSLVEGFTGFDSAAYQIPRHDDAFTAVTTGQFRISDTSGGNGNGGNGGGNGGNGGSNGGPGTTPGNGGNGGNGDQMIKNPDRMTVSVGEMINWTLRGFQNPTGNTVANFTIVDMPGQGLNFQSGRLPAFTNGTGITYEIRYTVAGSDEWRTYRTGIDASRPFEFSLPQPGDLHYTNIGFFFGTVPADFGHNNEIVLTFVVGDNAPNNELINRFIIRYGTVEIERESPDRPIVIHEINDEDVPLGEWVWDDDGTWIFIQDQHVPLDTPQTGLSGIGLYLFMMAVSITGFAVLVRSRKRKIEA